MQSIYNEVSTENTLWKSHLEFGFSPGYIPVLWLGIDSDFVKDVTFRRLRVLSVYNPAFFFEKLRAESFRVVCDPGRAPRVEYQGKGMKSSLDSLAGAVKSIQEHLFQEDAVIKIMLDPLQRIESGELPQFDRLNISLEERFSHE